MSGIRSSIAVSNAARRRANHPRSGRPAMFTESLERRMLLTSVVVNTVLDQIDAAGSSTVSLRDAIAIANASSTPTTITFSPTVFATPKTITLNGTELSPGQNSQLQTITGPAAGVTISGNGKSRVLAVGNFNTGNVAISRMSIVDGDPIGPSTNVGGGIYNQGNLSLTDVTVSGNTSPGDGGGIESSLIFAAHTSLTLTNVTISGNKSGSGNGNGGGGLRCDGNVLLRDVTISGNSAANNGGGISVGNASISIGNTIVAGNAATGSGPDVIGTFTSVGHNLVGKTDGSTGWISSDLKGTIAKPLNAELGSLANNGGPTLTEVPRAGSPVIGAGSISLIPAGITTDQRGLPRTVNGKVDIGAVEVQAAVAVTIKLTPAAAQSAVATVSKSFALGSFTQSNATGPFTVTVNWGDGSASSTIKVASAGTIPATAHTFAKSATDTLTITVTDSKGHKSNTITFNVTVAAAASISGEVFNDVNGNGKIDTGEEGLGLWTVYLDLNHDGKLDTGDKSVTTDIFGKWSFKGLAAGTYTARIVPVTGSKGTAPASGALTIKLAAGQVSSGNLFGERTIA
jgi:predicted outer membrane repeat protein